MMASGLVETHAVAFPDRRLAREVLPALDRDIDVARVDFDRVANALDRLSGDQRRSTIGSEGRADA